jgi:hypothetical protein
MRPRRLYAFAPSIPNACVATYLEQSGRTPPPSDGFDDLGSYIQFHEPAPLRSLLLRSSQFSGTQL